ncbi:hypothetical protein CP532_2548, partial [Ophiocordyceps camponoti-leonardi (nom. inval.)]
HDNYINTLISNTSRLWRHRNIGPKPLAASSGAVHSNRSHCGLTISEYRSLFRGQGQQLWLQLGKGGRQGEERKKNDGSIMRFEMEMEEIRFVVAPRDVGAGSREYVHRYEGAHDEKNLVSWKDAWQELELNML